MGSLADIDSVIGPQPLRTEHGVAVLRLINFLVYVDRFSIQAAILDLLSLVPAVFLTKCVRCGRYTTVVNPGKNAVAYLVDLGVFNAKPLSKSTEPGQVARTRARSFLLCVHGVIGS